MNNVFSYFALPLFDSLNILGYKIHMCPVQGNVVRRGRCPLFAFIERKRILTLLVFELIKKASQVFCFFFVYFRACFINNLYFIDARLHIFILSARSTYEHLKTYFAIKRYHFVTSCMHIRHVELPGDAWQIFLGRLPNFYLEIHILQSTLPHREPSRS